MKNGDTVRVKLCARDGCGQVIDGRSDQVWCSNACKQAGHRKRVVAERAIAVAVLRAVPEDVREAAFRAVRMEAGLA